MACPRIRRTYYLNFETEGIKLAFENIMFEVTRQCNLNCNHCMRGDSQNITMSKEIIDKVVPQILIAKKMSLTGGEPMLVPDTINYLVDKLIENKTPIFAFSSVVNGTILDDRAIKTIDAFNKIGEYIYNNSYRGMYKSKNIDLPDINLFKEDPSNKDLVIAAISVSADEFHGNDVQKAIDFYKKYANEYVRIYNQDEWERELDKNKDKKINLKENKQRLADTYSDMEYSWVDNTGRAKKNNLGRNETEYTINDDSQVNNHCCNICHRVEMIDEFIACTMEITANGHFCIGKQTSYDYEDKYYICNVLTQPLSCALIKWQWREPLLCRELEVLLDCETKLKHNKNLSESDIAMLKLARDFLMKKRDCIKRAHFMYPGMSYKDIVKGVNAELNIHTEGNFTKVLSVFLPDYDKNYVYDRNVEQGICDRLMRNKYNLYGNYNNHGCTLNILNLFNSII